MELYQTTVNNWEDYPKWFKLGGVYVTTKDLDPMWTGCMTYVYANSLLLLTHVGPFTAHKRDVEVWGSRGLYYHRFRDFDFMHEGQRLKMSGDYVWLISRLKPHV